MASSEKQLQILFEAQYEPLRNFLYYKYGDMMLAEDIAQDSFLKIWESRNEIDIQGSVGLLFTIGKNLAINKLRHQQVVLKFKTETPKSVTLESPQYQMEVKEFEERLQNCLSKLPEKVRETFLLNRIDKQKYKNIAEQMGVGIKAIEKRMSQALKALRRCLNHKI